MILFLLNISLIQLEHKFLLMYKQHQIFNPIIQLFRLIFQHTLVFLLFLIRLYLMIHIHKPFHSSKILCALKLIIYLRHLLNLQLKLVWLQVNLNELYIINHLNYLLDQILNLQQFHNKMNKHQHVFF